MDKENDILSDAMSLINIESPVLPVNVPVNSAAEKYPPITVETNDVHTETDPVVKANESKDLGCSPASSSGRNNYFTPNISSNDDHNSDRPLHRSTSFEINSSDKSPNQKKEVRFANNLVAVREFSEHDLLKISKSAYADLKVPQNSLDEKSPKSAKGKSKFKSLIFIPQFRQPGGHPQFFERVWKENVCLENVILNGRKVKGFIRVSNLSLQKEVLAVYTTNGWKTKTEVVAKYVHSNSDDYSNTDRFMFNIHLSYMKLGVRLIFVIKYVVSGKEFWDNNYGNNYTLECVADNS